MRHFAQEFPRWFLPAVVGMVMSLGFTGAGFAQPRGGGPPAIVETMPVTRDRVYEELRLTGTVTPRRFTYVMSDVSGLVEEVFVDDGDVVMKGQPLVKLRGAPTQFELDEARANMAQIQAELDELVNGERPEDIRAREAEVTDARARLALAEDEEKRVRELLEAGVTSQSNYDQRRAELNRARATLELAEAALDRARNGARPEEIAGKRAEVESARARANRLEDQLIRHALLAPFSGVVGQKSTEVGQWLPAGTAAFALAEIDVLRVEVNLPERYYTRVPLRMKAQVSFDALGPQTREAAVTIRVPLGNQSSRTFPVRLDVPNDGYQIALGMSARVSFLVSNGDLEEALLVPKDALLVEGTGSTRRLWVVQDGESGKEAHQRTVRTVGFFRDLVVIADGDLEENELVIVRGNEGIMFPGQPVNPRPHQPRTSGEGADAAQHGGETAPELVRAAGNGGGR